MGILEDRGEGMKHRRGDHEELNPTTLREFLYVG
jgi:hypothetical protein